MNHEGEIVEQKKMDIDKWLNIMVREDRYSDEIVLTVLSIMTMIHTCVLTKS